MIRTRSLARSLALTPSCLNWSYLNTKVINFDHNFTVFFSVAFKKIPFEMVEKESTIFLFRTLFTSSLSDNSDFNQISLWSLPEKTVRASRVNSKKMQLLTV